MQIVRSESGVDGVVHLWAASDAPFELEVRRIVEPSGEFEIPHRSELYTIKVWHPRCRLTAIDEGCRFLCPYFVSETAVTASVVLKDVIHQLRRVNPAESAVVLHGQQRRDAVRCEAADGRVDRLLRRAGLHTGQEGEGRGHAGLRRCWPRTRGPSAASQYWSYW